MATQIPVTVETKVWEKDWRFILERGLIKRSIGIFSEVASKRRLFINNVTHPQQVGLCADELVDEGIIDDYVFVEDYADASLKFFDLKRSDFGKGFYYSIAELVSIYLCETEFLLHFSGDTYALNAKPDLWLYDAVKVLRDKDDVSVFNLTWDEKFLEAERDAEFQDKNFFYGYGFSDQMYLIRAGEFRKNIYKHHHPASDRYPKYGGELFEKRVDSWMRTTNRLRATSRNWSYRHRNFPQWNSLQGLIYRAFPKLL